MANRGFVLLPMTEEYLERSARNYKRLSHPIQLPCIEERFCKITDIVDPSLASHMVKPVRFVHPLELYRIVVFKTFDTVSSYSPCPKALDDGGHLKALHGFFKLSTIYVTFQMHPPPLRTHCSLQPNNLV